MNKSLKAVASALTAIKPEEKYWTKLKRLQQNKSKKWYDPKRSVCELISVPEKKYVLAVEENGTIAALNTEDSKTLAAQVDWQVALGLPPYSLKGKNTPTEIWHAALDSETGQLYFSFFPIDVGVYQINLSDVEKEAKLQLITEEVQIKTITKQQQVAAAAEQNKKSSTTAKQVQLPPAEEMGPAPLITRGKTMIPEETSGSGKEERGLFLEKSKSSLAKLTSPNSAKSGANNLKLVCFIQKILLADGHPRWFFGLAAVGGALYVCHRHRPNAISIWSTVEDNSYGQFLYEISQPAASEIMPDFQPFCCAGLNKSATLTMLAVADSQHRLMVFDVKKDQGKILSAEISQVIATKKGKENGQLQFPLGLHFSGQNQQELWVADGANGRIQVFETVKQKGGLSKGQAVWKHSWSSITFSPTVINTAPGTTTHSLFKNEKNAGGEKMVSWVRSVTIPRDSAGRIYILIALSEKEVLCLGIAG